MATNILDKLKKKKAKEESEKKDKKLFKKSKKEDSSEDNMSMVKSLVRKGYEAVKENSQRQKERLSRFQGRLRRTWIPNGGTKRFIFLNEEPLTWREHRVKLPGSRFTEMITCTGDGCHLCAIADGKAISYSQFVGGYIVIDTEPYVIQSGPNKGKTIENGVYLYVEGQMALSQLDKMSEKFGLTKYIWECSKENKTRTYIPDKKLKKLSPEQKKAVADVLKEAGVKNVDALILKQVEMQTYSNEYLEERFGGVEEEEEPKRKNKKLRDF